MQCMQKPSCFCTQPTDTLFNAEYQKDCRQQVGMAEASVPLLLLQMYQVSMSNLAHKTTQTYLICTATDTIWYLFIF